MPAPLTDLPSLPHPPEAVRGMPTSVQIYHSLRQQIVDIALEPGTNLNRHQIGEAYKVSQSPVRDAFQRLEAEGLIEIFPQSKTIVARIDMRQARETQFLRLALELEVCGTLIRNNDPSAVVPAERALAHQRQALDQDDLERFAKLDWEFHFSLCNAVGYPQLWEMISARSGHIDRLRKLNLPDPGKSVAVVDYHSRIIEGIKAGDAAATEQAVRGHLSGTLLAAEDIRRRYPDYF